MPTINFDGDQQKLASKIDQLNAKIVQMQDKLRGASASGKQVDSVFGKAFKSPIADLGRMAANIVTVTAAVSVLQQGLQAVAQLRLEAGERTKESAGGLGKLGQLAGGSPDKLSQMRAQAENILRKGATDTLGQAADMLAGILSAELGDEVGLFTELAASQIVKTPKELAEAVTALQTSLGKDETGSLKDVISKGFAVGEISPGLVEEIIVAAAGSAGPAKALGLTDEEVLAATGVTAKAAGTIGEGGTQTAAFLTALAKDEGGRFEGLSIEESINKIAEMNLSPQELFALFGRKEAVLGYNALSDPANLSVFRDLIKSQGEAVRTDLTGQNIATALSDPDIAATRIGREAKAQNDLSTQYAGREELLFRAELDRREAMARQSGDSEIGIALDRFGRNALRRVGLETTFVEDKSTGDEFGNAQIGRGRNDDRLQELNEVTNKQKEAAKAMKEAAEKQVAAANVSNQQTRRRAVPTLGRGPDDDPGR